MVLCPSFAALPARNLSRNHTCTSRHSVMSETTFRDHLGGKLPWPEPHEVTAELGLISCGKRVTKRFPPAVALRVLRRVVDNSCKGPTWLLLRLLPGASLPR